MKRFLSGFVSLAALAVLGACQIADKTTAPTAGKIDLSIAKNCTLTTQADWDALIAEALALYVDGSPSESQALAKINNLIHQCDIADYTAAENKAWDLANFTLNKYEQGSLAPGVTKAQVDSFVGALLAAAGVITSGNNYWIVEPTDNTKTFYTEDGKAALTVSGTDVDATTIITASPLPFDPGNLSTNLDQYPRYYQFSKTSQDGSTTFNNNVIVAICVLAPTGTPQAVIDRLRLGHQSPTYGFSVATYAPPPSGLDCDATPSTPIRLKNDRTSTTSTRLGTGVGGVSAAIIDDSFGTLEERGGVGGLADNFSDFGVVDPYADARGGVGGLADNFRPGARRLGTTESAPAEPTTPATAQRLTTRNVTTPDGAAENITLQNVTAACTTPITGLIGSALPAECRPTVTIQSPTANTNFAGVPVTFTVTAGGGSIAQENTDGSCGPFSSSVTVNSMVYTTGGPTQARICWTLGTTVEDNTVSATAAPGGDIPDATGFIYEASGATSNSIVFTAAAMRYTPVATIAGGGSFVYSGSAFAATGSCTYNGSPVLSPVITYTPGGSSAPVNVGTYTATVTCGDNGNLYNTTTASTTITVTPAPSTTTVTCPASVVYNGSAQTPCSASATNATTGLNQSLTVNYSPASPTNVGQYTASATFTNANYATSSDSKTFDITPAQATVALSCPTSVAYNGAVQNPCTAGVSGAGGLSQSLAVVYSPTTVKDAGAYTASASFPTGGNYTGGSDTKSFSVTKLTATATAGSASMDFGSAVPAIGCTVTGLLPVDAGSITCTTPTPTSPGAGTYTLTPVVSPATPTNYNVTLVNGTLTVRGYVQVGCFSAPIYNVMPDSKSAQRKGSNLPVKCTLTWPNGTAVTNATGSIEVYNAGTVKLTNPAPTPAPGAIPIFTSNGANVFKFSTGGNYAYGLDTSPAGFVAGRYYLVIATWKDGSKSTGWFLLK